MCVYRYIYIYADVWNVPPLTTGGAPLNCPIERSEAMETSYKSQLSHTVTARLVWLVSI